MLKKICFYIVFNLFLCVSFAFFNYGKSDNTHHFEANQMTIDYHITIGKKLTSKEVVKIQKMKPPYESVPFQIRKVCRTRSNKTIKIEWLG